MKNNIYILTIVTLCFFILEVGCTKKCFNSVYFQVSAIDPNEKLTVNIDDGNFHYEKLFDDGFIMSEKKRCFINKSYCSDLEMIKVYISINNQCDTTIYINKSQVAGCLIGSTINGCPSLLFDSIPPGKPFSFGEK
ncbi:MAG TPA: hypothetical protein PLJ00_15820 [Chitinophagales bacterium]|nr:hypothetical protein [Chitinophagales bacterium]HRG87068.1 hypothetical protein [Chitinophagales bacterium]HRH53576.1 hypothetical protein [Chitinophagales bacterium]